MNNLHKITVLRTLQISSTVLLGGLFTLGAKSIYNSTHKYGYLPKLINEFTDDNGETIYKMPVGYAICAVTTTLIIGINIATNAAIKIYQALDLSSVIDSSYKYFKDENILQINFQTISLLKKYHKNKIEMKAVLQNAEEFHAGSIWIPNDKAEERLTVYSKMDEFIKQHFTRITGIANDIENTPHTDLLLPKDIINHIFSF